MGELSPSNSEQLLRPYFTVVLPASAELTNLFDQAIALTAVYGNGKVHLEHAFSALLDSGSSTGKDLLMSVGIDLFGLKSSLLPYLQALPKVPPEPLTISSNTRDSLAGSTEEARATNYREVESVHFVLSAIKVTPENPLWHLHDITYEKLIRNYTQNNDAF